MADEQSFLEEICANPDDETPRLIFADWLEEQGNPRGEFIRVQCEMTALKKTQKRYKELAKREHSLLWKHEAEWTAALPYSMRRCVFRRGFVEECSIALSYFLRNWKQVLQLTPLRQVTFNRVKDQLVKLAECPGLSRLQSIRMKNQHPRTGVEELARSPHLEGVESIQGRWTTEGLVGLAESIHASKLKHVIFDGQMMPAGVEQFCNAEHLNLETIDVSASVTPDSVKHFCDAKFAPALRELNINGVTVDDRQLEQFAESTKLKRLTVLRASIADMWLGIRGPGLEAMANSPVLSQLRTLVLSNHPLSYESIVSVGESPYRRKGARFYFGGNRSDYGATLTAEQIAEVQERFGKSFGDLSVPRARRY